MNVYDFDKTIYEKDSTVEFYKFCFKRNRRVWLSIPVQIWGLFMYVINIYDLDKFKESFFSFLRHINNVEYEVEEFWEKEYKGIKEWYVNRLSEDDVIISASPSFLLKPIIQRIGLSNLISTEVDMQTGRMNSKNCKGIEKVHRFKEIFGDTRIDEMYSDSLTDAPLASISEKPYLVIGDKIEEWKEEDNSAVDFLETIRYIFWGGITTLINILLFAVFVGTGVKYEISNIVTYFIAVFISYFFNRRFVFKDTSNVGTVWSIIKYYGVRVMSIICETFLLWIMVDVIALNVYFSKIILSVLVIVGTYMLNKLLVFSTYSA